MKKIVYLLAIFFLFTSGVSAGKSDFVELEKCIDGDTAKFIIDGEVKSVRFLAIDTPESTNKIEKYGKQASEFTCEKLTAAKTIELEYDPNSDKTDKYDRVLAWIWVDGELLQDEIVLNGYAPVAYLYGDYMYTDLLEESEKFAIANKLNIWSDPLEEFDFCCTFLVFPINLFLSLVNYVYFGKHSSKKSIIKNIFKMGSGVSKTIFLILYAITVVPVLYDLGIIAAQKDFKKRI